MANKKVLIKDQNGNDIYPKTWASLVYNESGNYNLGSVEEGAQVNKIEKITVNGKEVSVVSKTAEITVASAEYSIVKDASATSGYSATYHLTKDGANIGEAINIPKDMVVESGSVKECSQADDPVAGYKVGDKYIDLVLANKDNSHVYILVSDLVDVYTAGNGINVTGNEISIDTSVVADKQTLNTELGKKQDKLSDAQLQAVDSGITSAKVATYDGYQATINLKANTSDVYTKAEITGMNLLTYNEIV